MSGDEPGPGLRQRKKQAMHATLSAVALRLAAERGVAQVRIEDIAAEAGVSPRTFSNYFPSKEAAIVGVSLDRADRFRTALKTRPPGEPLPIALQHAVLALFPEEPDRTFVARTQLVRSEPALLAAEHTADLRIENVLTEEIAARTGISAAHLFPRLAAATLLAAMHTAVRHWVAAPDGESLRATLLAAMRHLNLDPPQR